MVLSSPPPFNYKVTRTSFLYFWHSVSFIAILGDALEFRGKVGDESSVYLRFLVAGGYAQ